MGQKSDRQHRRRDAKIARAFEDALQKQRDGKSAAAQTAYRRLLKAEPNHFAALMNLGLMAFHSGDYPSAVAFIVRAKQVDPNNAGAHYNLGSALAGLGRLDEAVAEYTLALRLEPNHSAAHSNLGNTLRLQGRLDQAIAACEKAVALAPGNSDAQNNLGCALQENGALDAAIAAFRNAVEANTGNAAMKVNFGFALHESGMYDDARSQAETAIGIDPENAKAHKLLGATLHCTGLYEQALAALDKSILINPRDHDAVNRRAQIRLAMGDFEGGWSDYRKRPNLDDLVIDVSRRKLSSSLAGKRILVLGEQGLGDEIFFLRFAAELKAMGAWIAYQADPKIAGMVGRLPFIDQIIEPHEQLESIDHRFVSGDLPFILGMTALSYVPPPIKLTVDADKAEAMKRRMHALGPPPYIGVTWRAGSGRKGMLSKQTPPERIGDALRPIAGTVIVVQRNPEAGDMNHFDQALGRASHDFSALNEDLDAMVALMDLLDDYVCVSNTNVHLRTARGHACRVLIPSPPEYRWMASSDESPWFPGTSLYRETHESGWDDAYKDLAAALAENNPAKPVEGPG